MTGGLDSLTMDERTSSSARARLVFDSSSSRARADLRDSATAGRSLLFRLRELAVDLTVHESRGSLRVVEGRITDEANGCPVVAARVHFGRDTAVASSDGHGRFAASALLGDESDDVRIDTPQGPVLCRIPAPTSFA